MSMYHRILSSETVKMGPVKAGKTKADNNRYCGPAVISSLTGCTTGEAAYLIRKINRRKQVTGTDDQELFRVLRTFNITAYCEMNVTGKDRPTLAAWLKQTHGKRGGKTFLIIAGNHWQLVSGNKYVCGITRQIVDLKHEKVKRRARVTKVWEIKMRAGMTKPVTPAKHPRLIERAKELEAKKVERKTGPRAQFVKLAKQHGWKWEITYDDYLEIEECTMFPRGLITMHYNWTESLERVENCIKYPDDITEEGYYSE